MRGALTGLLLLSAPTAMASHSVTFVIDMRQEIAAGRFDPKAATVGVRGGVAPLSWVTTTPAKDADGDGRYEVTVTFPRAPFGSQPVAYKFKVDRDGPPNSGWEEGRNRQVRLGGERQTLERPFDSPPEPIARERTGDIRTHAGFASKLVLARDVQVYLPPRYDQETALRYPVLYLQDGQNVFDAAAVGMDWQVDETAELLIRSGAISPLIVVAVSNTEARTDEYTPTFVDRALPDGMKVRGGGKASLYARFLVEELKPFIDRTYRTRTDPASTAIGGSSHGGLVSLYVALEHPEVFGHALVMSPSAMWDDDVLIKRVRALPRKLPVRFWLDTGLLEHPGMVAAARRLRDALLAKGWHEGQDLRFVEQAEGGHDEISWASRVPDALQFLWPRNRRSPSSR
jgi:predicted alpha/beta superfamily hydrolase